MREQNKQEEILGADAAAVDEARSAEAVSQRSHDAKHTPGPWMVESFTSRTGSFTVMSDEGYYIANTIELFDGQEEERINAHLISAAPDLYEALRALLPIAERMERACDSGETFCYDNEYDRRDADAYLLDIRRAQAALKKAEGGQ